MFSIIIASETEDEQRLTTGAILLDGMHELFQSSLREWTADYYRMHWRYALERVHGGRDAALITSYASPENSSYLIWWPMYCVDERIEVQNQLLFYDQLESPFELYEYWESLPARDVSEDGEPISRWTLSRAEINAFFHSASYDGLGP